MKLKVVVIDFELSRGAKKWAVRAGAAALLLGVATTAIAVPLKSDWKNGDVLTAADLNANFGSIEQRLAALELGADCPAGYAPKANAGGPPGSIVCNKGVDEVVKVGRGASAFWMDRYEASVWEKPSGATLAELGVRYFKDSDNDSSILQALPKNGQWSGTTPPAHALSVKGVVPSRYLTWFQAQTLCRASGKRLPSGDEWLEAGKGTVDPGEWDGSANKCVTQAGSPRNTGQGSQCVSHWGAEDMIGNLWEYTNEWGAGLGNATQNVQPWPATLYGDDGTWNIESSASDGAATKVGLPSAAVRGGNWGWGVRSGLFALSLDDGPSRWDPGIGLRCALAR